MGSQLDLHVWLYDPSKRKGSNNGQSVLLKAHKCQDQDSNPHSAEIPQLESGVLDHSATILNQLTAESTR